MDDDTPSIGEQMNRDLFLDPGLEVDDDGLLDEAEEEIDETAERAKNAPKPSPPD